MEKVIQKPLQEAVLSLLVFISSFCFFAILGSVLVPLQPLFLFLLFLASWALFYILGKATNKEFTNTLLLASAMALIPSAILSTATGINILLLFLVIQPALYGILRGKISGQISMLPLLLAIFYLPLLLPLVYI